MPNFTYRQATTADFDLTFSIKCRSIKPYVEIIWGWDQQVQLAFHRQTFDPPATQLILDEGDHSIGLLVLEQTPDSIYIRNLLIDQSAQGRGIGSAIIRSIIERAQATHQGVELQVYQVNHRAKKLYERLGFQVTGQTQHHYQMAWQGSKADELTALNHQVSL